MVRVAVIDDGINFSSEFSITKSIEIDSELRVSTVSTVNPPYSVHGSICASIIHKYYSCVEFCSIRILADKLRGTCEQLIKAIEWCMEHDIRVINMSLGTTNYKDFPKLKECIKLAYKKEIIMVVACHNENILTYPAFSEYVIGVKADKAMAEGQYSYNLHPLDGIEINACGCHYLDVSEKKTEVCNSYAAPMITAMVCRIIEQYPAISLEAIKFKLYENACNYTQSEFRVALSESDVGLYYQEYKLKREIDVPIIVICDRDRNIVESYEEYLNQQFCKNGYYAFTVNKFFTPCDENLFSALTYLTERGQKENLEKLYQLTNFDILLIGCQEEKDIRIILEEVEVDIVLLGNRMKKSVISNVVNELRDKSKFEIVPLVEKEITYKKLIDMLNIE